MYVLLVTSSFRRDVKKFLANGGDEGRLQRALESLKEGGPLPAAFRDHQLSGKLRLYREMHIEHDWLLVYKKDGKNLRVVCIWLVNHHDLKIRDRNI